MEQGDTTSPAVTSIVDQLRELEPPQIRATRQRLVRELFFDHQLLPWQIHELTGIPESSTRAMCSSDPRYDEQADLNRRRRRSAQFEQDAARWRAAQQAASDTTN